MQIETQVKLFLELRISNRNNQKYNLLILI
jgi:hypothetical protein